MTTVTDAETFENQLKKTIAPNKIRNLLLDNGESTRDAINFRLTQKKNFVAAF